MSQVLPSAPLLARLEIVHVLFDIRASTADENDACEEWMHCAHKLIESLDDGSASEQLRWVDALSEAAKVIAGDIN